MMKLRRTKQDTPGMVTNTPYFIVKGTVKIAKVVHTKGGGRRGERLKGNGK